jgi:hypothetical protein
LSVEDRGIPGKVERPTLVVVGAGAKSRPARSMPVDVAVFQLDKARSTMLPPTRGSKVVVMMGEPGSGTGQHPQPAAH